MQATAVKPLHAVALPYDPHAPEPHGLRIDTGQDHRAYAHAPLTSPEPMHSLLVVAHALPPHALRIDTRQDHGACADTPLASASPQPMHSLIVVAQPYLPQALPVVALRIDTGYAYGAYADAPLTGASAEPSPGYWLYSPEDEEAEAQGGWKKHV